MLMRTTWRMVVSLMVGKGASNGVMVLEAVAQVAAQCLASAAAAPAKGIASSARPARNPPTTTLQPGRRTEALAFSVIEHSPF